MKKVVCILILFSSFLVIKGQELLIEPPFIPKFNIGLGAGIDYGGFGGRLSILGSEKLQFFVAAGYNLLGVGFNGGANLRILPKRRICPYIGGMYGYNGFILVSGLEQYNQTYYGPSLNSGIEIWSAGGRSFFNCELILPFRSSEFHADIRDLRNNPNIIMKNEPMPVLVSFGYHFAFH